MNSAKRRLRVCAISLGFSTFLFQFLFLKESLTVYWGNELVIALIISVWLVLTGIGTSIKRVKIHTGLFLMAVLAPMAIVCLRYLSPIMVVRGEMAGPFEVIFITMVSVGPFCVVSGALFSRLLKGMDDVTLAPRLLYGLEALGAFFGGLFYTFIASHMFQGLELAFWCSFSLFLVLFLTSTTRRPRFIAVISMGCVLILIIPGLRALHLEEITLSSLYHGVTIDEVLDTPYGKIVHGGIGGEEVVFFNNALYYDEASIQRAEESVHYAMAQRKGVKSVLAIGGGPKVIQELEKYPGVEITYMDIDPLLVDLARKGHGQGALVHFVVGDPRTFFESKKSGPCFDVILLNMPDPSSSSINRLYTREFFESLKGIMKENGVLSIGLYHYTNHLSKDGAYLLGSVRNALLNVFKGVLIIPGGRLYMLSSDGPLTLHISARLDAMGIQREFVREAYLKGYLTRDRMEYIQSILRPVEFVNRDTRPITYYYYVLEWLKGYRGGQWLLAFFIGVVIFWELVGATSAAYAMFTTGVFSMGAGLLLLLLFQAQWGSLYRDIGLFTGVYMLGSALGGMWHKGASRGRYWVFVLEGAMVLFSALLFLSVLFGLTPWAHGMALLCLNGLLGILVVESFGGLSGLGPRGGAPRIYRSDLVGAAVGAILVSLVFIPLWGLRDTALFLGGIKATSMLFLSIGVLGVARLRLVAFGGLDWSRLFLGAVLACGAMIYFYNPRLFYGSRFYGLAFTMMMLGLSLSFIKNATGLDVFRKGGDILKWLPRAIQLLLIPFLLFPFITCPYKLPFVFCASCPRRCPWGDMRGFIFTGALLLNLDGLSFCGSKCPFGALQARLFWHGKKIGGFTRKEVVPQFMRWSVFSLVGALLIVSYTPFKERLALDAIFLGHTLDWPLLLLFFTLLLSVFFSRPWCRFICPIGTLSRKLAQGVERLR